MNAVERFAIRPGYDISRVIRGGWQLAGGHGVVVREQAVADLLACAEAGITTFDGADIYTGVEEMFGAFRKALANSHGRAALASIKVHTKCVPDLALLPRLARAHVRAIVDESLRRLGMERLDLVQFHWWDYAVPGCVEAALWLDELRREGKIDLIGATNFDVAHVEAIAAAGVPLATLQLQYSLVDARPRKAMVEACRRHGIALLCYGSVAGGFLAERWLGAAEPREPFENRSLRKYKLIIDDVGGWGFFQGLLDALARVAARRATDIATVASRTVLDRPGVAAVIVGARSGAHLGANLAVTALRLSDDDRHEIDAALAGARPLDGDVFDLERDRTGRHGAIMKYNLNSAA